VREYVKELSDENGKVTSLTPTVFLTYLLSTIIDL